MDHEIAHATEQSDRLEDQILKSYTEVEDRATEFPKHEAALADAKKELAAFGAKSEAGKIEFTEELRKANPQVSEFEVQLAEGALLVHFVRLIRQRWKPGLSDDRRLGLGMWRGLEWGRGMERRFGGTGAGRMIAAHIPGEGLYRATAQKRRQEKKP